MNRTFARKSTAIGLLALFLAGAAFGSSSRPAAALDKSPAENWASVQVATGKLEELRDISGKLRKTGESIDVTLRTLPGHRDSHAYKLRDARQHINAAGVLLADLERMKHQLAPWQRQAVDTITPIAAQLAAHTQAAIVHLNERPHHRFAAEYTANLRGIVDHSVAMKDTVSDFLDYADSKSKVQALETTLDIDRS